MWVSSWSKVRSFLVFVHRLNNQLLAEFLQDRLKRETSEAQFSELPFRFAEVAKVLLDVYVGWDPSKLSHL